MKTVKKSKMHWTPLFLCLSSGDKWGIIGGIRVKTKNAPLLNSIIIEENPSILDGNAGVHQVYRGILRYTN
jgi:hypothetical protein